MHLSLSRSTVSPVAVAASPAPSATSSRLQALLLALVVVWSATLLVSPSWLADAGLALNAHGHSSLYSHGHPFVDARAFWGIPNTLDVMTNLPFLLAGCAGLWCLKNPGNGWARENRSSGRVFFAGLCLTAFGSATYHWLPNAWTLVGDRMGMAVTFAGAAGLVLSHRCDRAVARPAMWGMLLLAAVSAILPATGGQMLPWAVVQFGGVLLIAVAACVRPDLSRPRFAVGMLISLYVLAKLLEMGDELVYEATRHWVSGHSLKHMVAALAAWPVCAAVKAKPPVRAQAECA